VSFFLYVVGLLLIAVVAWAAASAFFSPSTEASPIEPTARPREHWRRQKEEALVAIKDAEFDHQLGKLSDDDYRELRRRLETQALAAIAELER
jgi:hypothetical protein